MVLISDLILDRSDEIISMILGTIASAAIVYAIHFFRFTLDYSGVEYAQFEDDVYYYYVKAVPKITVTAPQKNVKHFNVKNVDKNISKTNSYNYDDADIDDYMRMKHIFMSMTMKMMMNDDYSDENR